MEERLKRYLVLLWLVGLGLLWPRGAGAQTALVYSPADLSIHVQHETLVFHPVVRVVRTACDPYVSLTDPAMVRLLQVLGASMSVSADQGTVTSQIGTVRVDWDVNAGAGVVRGKAEQDPMAAAVRNGEVVLALHAVMHWLGLSLVPIDEAHQEYQLLASLSDLSVGVEDGVRRVHLVGTGLSWLFLPNTDGSLRVDLPNTVCNLAWDHLDLGGASVVVQSHGTATSPTRVLLTFDTYWRGVPDNQHGTVDLRPDYPVAVSGEDAHLTGLTLESGPGWRIDTSDTVGYAWHWADHVLAVDLVQCLPDPTIQIPAVAAGVEKLEMSVLCQKPYGVTRLVFRLAPDAGVTVVPRPSGAKRDILVTTGSAVALSAQRVSGFDAGGPVALGTVVIDPGHGGSDPGAISPISGLMEKDVTLDVGLRLQRLLQAQGWHVVMTRTDDRDLTYAGSPDREELGARAAVADTPGTDAFISIHCNANHNPACRGTSIHWYKPEDYTLATVMRDDLAAALGIPSNGTEQSPFYVVKHNRVPAILIETAYVTNGEDVALLGTPEFRAKLAESIAGALNRWMLQKTH